jgi:chromosome segregation ATPase
MVRRKNGTTNVTVEILRGIRDEIRAMRTDVNERLEGLGVRIDETNARLDQTNARLDVHEQALGKLVREVHTLNERMDNFLTGAHRQEHEELKARLDRLERRAG